LPADLPVFHGELPGQDYPAGATSTALATAANRGNHATLPAAETLATAASHLCAYPYPATDLWTAFEDVIYHDEHTWGHSRNVGPAKIASEAEKAVHAYRAAALGHDVLRKAMAQLADQVALEEEGFYLCVFNPEALPRTGPVRLPLREIDNASSAMHWVTPEEDPEGHGFWQGVALLTRGPAILPPELVAGGFSLLDVATGETVPHQLVDLTAPHDPVPYAPERVGSAVGGPHCGMLDLPHGLGRDLCFLAREVPACGYRTYRLLPGTTGVSPGGASDISPVGGSGVPPVPPLSPLPCQGRGLGGEAALENAFYRLEVDPATGALTSLYDKSHQRELVDASCPHPFGSVIVRSPLSEEEFLLENVHVSQRESGPLCASLLITGSAPGVPQITQTVTLYSDVPEVHFAARLLKDCTPLQEISLAFPFAAQRPQWRYEGNFSALDPATDLLPGAYWNRLTVQNWVHITDGDFHLLWSSLDAPIVSLAGLWPDYLSPAHRCHLDQRLQRPPVSLEALSRNGWIYSHAMQNNFDTNFSLTQVADVLFRYVFTTHSGLLSDGQCALWGRQAVSPLTGTFTKRPGAGTLPPTAGFLELDSDEVLLLACKHAEDGRGLILRLWNLADRSVRAPVRLPLVEIAQVLPTNLIEEDGGLALPSHPHEFTVEIPARAVATVRVLPVETLP
ncbi:MAG: hypothetical protein GX100_00515, partial [candidate division WS1 bacterium]|nr:hypothetical protein [candidate division WS1 bacterium]